MHYFYIFMIEFFSHFDKVNFVEEDMCRPNYNENTVRKPKITMFLGHVLSDFHPVSNLKLL